MNERSFEVGDIVKLNSADHQWMTVLKVRDDGNLLCGWFYEGKFTDGVFDPRTVKKL